LTVLSVFLAQEQTMVREGLKLLIGVQPDMCVTGEGSGVQSILEQAAARPPDVVVLEISPQLLDALRLIRRLVLLHPRVKVLALSTADHKDALGQLLEAGASGFILLKASPEELILAIRSVCGGAVYIDSSLAGMLVGEMLETGNNSRHKRLSRREREVTRLLANGHSHKEIAAALNISVKTVETYKYRVMAKLDLHNKSELVQFALRSGLLQES
jgi:DNA-binding NarL/FixJ family response regulator